MNMNIKQQFLDRWTEFFPKNELPIVFFYTDRPKGTEIVEAPGQWRCFIAQLAAVRTGQNRYFNADSVTCHGGKRYLGFSNTLMPDFEYFLSCGIPGKLDGERYKKSPEIVNAMMANAPTFTAPATHLAAKRWDRLEPEDKPEIVVFFAHADALSGLFTLAGFDRSEAQFTIAPFCAGCGAIVLYPYLEKDKELPNAVLGMFDVSARPCVRRDQLSFAVPMPMLVRMMEHMPESFLTAPSWAKVKARFQGDE